MLLFNKTTAFAAWLAVCLCAFTMPLPAQKLMVKKLLFESITINDGLSQGMVTSIMQDRYGFLWFATKDGLNRYDGYHFVVYRHDALNKASLADNYVLTIFEDSNGRIWAGTASQGLDLFDRETETFTHFKHDSADAQSIADNSILELNEDKEGVLYVSTVKGLCTISSRKDKAGNDLFSFRQIDKRHYCKLLAAHKGKVWVAPAKDWLFTLNKTTGASETIPAFEKNNAGTLSKDALKNIQAFAHDSIHHIVYLMGSNGIVTYDEGKNSYEQLSTNTFNITLLSNPAVLDTSGILWLADFGRVLQYNTKTRTACIIKADNPAHNLMISSANCLFMDRSGILWIGTAGYGLLKYNARAEKFHRTGNESVRWLREDRDAHILVITKGDVAWLFDRRTSAYTGCVPDSSFIGGNLNNRGLDAVEQDGEGMYWLGKQQFLAYDAAKKRVLHPAFNRAFSFPLCLGDDGLIWMGTENSFCSYDKKGDLFTHYTFPVATTNEPYKFTQAIYRQSDNVFWLGTLNGLFRFQKNTGGWKQYKNKPNDSTSLSFDVVFSLCADPAKPNRYLWVGTNGGGFNRFDFTTEKFLRYSTKDGLPNHVVYGILGDENNNLWMSTNKGLSCFNPATKAFHNYEAKDGLQSNEFNRYAFCKTKDGTLFFGGVNGFNYFRPEELGSNAIQPNIVITDFKIGNKAVNIYSKQTVLHKPVYLTDKIMLNYADNMISFDFAAMDFTQPEKNLYQYKLDGFDKDWITSGTAHSATYTNLDPGTYTFDVKGSNSDGVWNEAGALLQIIVLPPWYMTWWFRGSIVALLLFAGYSFYRYRLAQAVKLHAVRNRIASDLHDEIGSNMSNVLIFSNIAHQKVERSVETAPLLKKITQYTQLSLDAISDIVWMINTRNDHFENIIVRMHTLAAELFEATPCTLHLHFDEKLNLVKLTMDERKNFYLIYKEALTNVAKYADCNDVWVELKLAHNKVVLKISDNGKGFDPKNISNGNGLFNMKARSKMLDGNLTVTSAPGEGTSVQLVFKAG